MSAREIGTSGYRDTSPSGDSMKKQTRTEYLESTGGDFATSDAKRMNAEATIATEAEHDLDFWAAVKKYKKAIAWSMIISASIVMEGYDTTLLGSFFGFPAFRRKYGTYINEEVGYQLSSKWQTGLNDIGAVGNIIGALGNGYFTPKYGHRKVMLVNLVAMTGFIFIVFFSPNLPCLLVGEFLCSIPWGCFTTMGPAYAAEVTPLALRGHLTAYVNLCWAIGQLLSAAVLKGLLNRTDSLGYKIPFAIQWIWPVPLFIACWMCPESPWYLVRVGRYDAAKHSLSRLSSDADPVEHERTVALMQRTTNLEMEMFKGASYWDCFRGTNLRRTEIACIAFASQVTDGGALVYSPTYFFEQAGISASAAYGIALGGTGIAFCGTCLSWLLLPRLGRRTIFLTGFSWVVISLFLIGILGCIPSKPAVGYAQAALAVSWLAIYSLTVGPIVYTIVAEIGATRLRTQTVVLGRSTYYVANIIGGVIQPYMINPTEWNLKGKTAFFWFGASFLTLVWAYFRLPETKDRTYEELDVLFEKRVSARKFQSTVVDAAAIEEVEKLNY